MAKILQFNIYNRKLKNFYLESIVSESRKAQMITVFRKSYNIESSLEKDLTEFSFEDFVTLFNINDWSVLNTFRNRKCAINHYLKWCHENGYCESETLLELDKLQKDDIKHTVQLETEFFKDFESLQRLISRLDVLTYPEHRENLEMSVAIVYLLWLGLTPAEIADLQLDGYDEFNSEIKVNEKVIKVENEIIANHLSKIKDKKGYYCLRKGRSTSDEYNVKPYEDTEHFIRMQFNGEINEMNIKQLVYILNNVLDKMDVTDELFSKKFYCLSIWKSGLFNRIKNVEDLLGVEFGLDRKEFSDGNTKELFNDLMNGYLFTGNELEANDNKKVLEYKEWKEFYYGV